MVRGSDPVKVSIWRERFDRFEVSEMKTAQFCGAEGVSKANFYAWRRKLGLTKGRTKTKGRANKKSHVFQQVMVSSAPAFLARLPGGIEIEASGEQTLRTIVNELVRASQNSEAEREAQKC